MRRFRSFWRSRELREKEQDGEKVLEELLYILYKYIVKHIEIDIPCKSMK